MYSILKRYLPIVLLFAFSCITPYDPNIKSGEPRIVVEGLLSNLPGVQKVRITQSAAYANGSAGITPGIDNATVYVTDDLGRRIDYFLSGRGYYFTSSDVQGEVGRSYQLHITLADGTEYLSEPDLLKPVPPIDSLYWEYDPAKKLINVYVDITDPETTGDGYYWRWEHYGLLQYCKLSETIVINGQSSETPCLTCCDFCWQIEQCYTCVNVANDQYVNGKKVKKQFITAVPYDGTTPYYLLIEQRSLSSNAYQFWNSIKVQSSNTGGPFDAAPAPIIGNIKNSSDSREKVLGFFGASSVIMKPYWIERNQINDSPVIPAQPICPAIVGPPPPCYPCMEEAGKRTGIAPPQWRF